MLDIAEKFLLLHEETDALIAVYDPADRLCYCNRAFRAAYHVEKDERPLWPDLMRRNYHAKRGAVVETADFEGWLTSVVSRRGKIASRSIESSLHDGRWIWIVETVMADGWMMFVGSDVTDLGRSERALRQDRDHALKAAVTDELTGVSNRRHILANLDRLVEQAERMEDAAFCLCLLDLDHFKSINDRLGHQCGDRVLTEFAQLVRSEIRLKDGFGRVGGEEFLLLFPQTDIAGAREVAERLLNLVSLSRPLPDFPDFSYGCSGGLVAWRHDDTAHSIYARADEALYRAKHAGRGRIAEL